MADILSLLDALPAMLMIADYVVYIFMAGFLGSISLTGLRRKLSFFVRTPVALGLGFLCVISGIGLSGFMPIQDELMKAFQLDIFLAGLIVSIIFSISIYLITKKENLHTTEKIISNLHDSIMTLENILRKHHVDIIPESKAKEIAEREMRGFKVKAAKTKEDAWEVILEKKKETAHVFIGVYDGLVRNVVHKTSPVDHLKSDPLRILGIVIIIAIVAFALLNFRGFPGFSERLSPYLGLPEGTLTNILGDSSDLPEGCVSPAKLALRYTPSLSEYQDDELKAKLAEDSGLDIGWMYQIEYDGEDYILAIESGFNRVCSATQEMLCSCIDIPDL